MQNAVSEWKKTTSGKERLCSICKRKTIGRADNGRPICQACHSFTKLYAAQTRSDIEREIEITKKRLAVLQQSKRLK